MTQLYENNGKLMSLSEVNRENVQLDDNKINTLENLVMESEDIRWMVDNTKSLGVYTDFLELYNRHYTNDNYTFEGTIDQVYECANQAYETLAQNYFVLKYLD